MNKGDIVVIYEDKLDRGLVYLSYDRNLLIRSTLFGFELVDVEDYENCNVAVFTLVKDIPRARRRKITDHIIKLITGQIKLTLRERNNFPAYINTVYKKIIGIQLVEQPLPVTYKNLISSNQLTRIQ